MSNVRHRVKKYLSLLKRRKIFLFLTFFTTATTFFVIFVVNKKINTDISDINTLENLIPTENCEIPNNFTSFNIPLQLPTLGEKNIFFIESWGRCDRMAHILPRTACAIEAASVVHPNWNIYFYFLNVDGYREQEKILMNTLLKLDNVQIINTTLEELADQSEIEDWVQSGVYKSSKFKVAHEADIARMLVLRKYGGLYMDLDIIALESFDALGSNYAVQEDWYYIVNGFINLGNDTVGREVSMRLVEEIPKIWDPNSWNAQGPLLVTRIFQERCWTKYVMLMTTERCHGLKYIENKLILSVEFKDRNVFFDDNQLQHGLKMINGALATHLWSSRTRTTLVNKTSPNLLNYLGKNYCPNVFSTITSSW